MPFCKQCGNKLEDSTIFCSECGTPTENKQVVQSEQAIYQEPVVMPIQEPAAMPTQGLNVNPVYVPVEQIYSEQNAKPVYGPLDKPKKSSTVKALIAVAVAVVTVVALACVIMFTPLALGLKNMINSSVQSPANYYKSIEKQNKDVTIKQLGNVYDKYLTSSNEDKTTAMELDFKVKVSEEFLESFFIPTSLTSVELQTYSAFSSKDGFMGEYSMHVNEEKFLDVTTYFDVANKTLIASIPQLTDKYLYGDFTDIFTEMMNDLELDFSSFDKIKKLDISSDELEKLLTRYTDLLVESASDVKREKNVELTVGDSTGKFTKITSIITQEDAAKLVKEILKEAKNDKTLIKIAEFSNISEDDYKDSIDELLNNFDDNVDVGSEEVLKIEIYVDSKGTIVGRNIGFNSDYNGFEVGYYVVKSSDKLDVSFFADFAGDGVEVTTSADINDNKYTGDLNFNVFDEYGFEQDLAIKYTDVETVTKKDVNYVNGIFEIDLDDLGVTDSAVKLELNEKENKQSIKFVFVKDDADAVSVEIAYGISEGAKISIPDFNKEDAYNFMDEDEMLDLLTSSDFENLIMPLEDILYDYNDLLGNSEQDERIYEDIVEVPIEDSYLYDYTVEELIGEWLIPATDNYFIFNSDGTVYLYSNQTMDPLNCSVGTYEAYAPAYDVDYNMIPGLDVFLYFDQTFVDGVDSGYKSFNYELIVKETGFELMNFETFEMNEVLKIK